jgi:hypothetical protein
MWLTGRLAPDFKTIADFRKAIPSVCRQFVVLCRNLNLFSQSIIAIDGSKFKAVNNRDCNFTQGKVKARMQQIEQSIDRYLAAMDSADRATPEVAEAKAERVKEKIETLKQQMQNSPDQQISLTDPDARSMATSGRGTGTVGYNVQTVVDDKHHLIIAHEVTNVGNDRGQLSNMANQAREEIGAESLTVVADRGYYIGLEILACEQAGITTFIPKPLTSGSKAEGRFGKQDFIYVAASDEYRCPAGQLLTRRHSSMEDGMLLHCYYYSGCQSCSMHKQCTTGNERRVRRWEHEGVIDAMQARLEHDPAMMRVRRQTVEHPFGTLKYWMGSTHFLTKNLPRVFQILGPNLLVWGGGLFIKEPNSPSYVSWHQDLNYWGLEGGEEVTAWLALSQVTSENGAMRFIPKSHKFNQVEHIGSFADNNLLTRGQELVVEVDETQAVVAELSAGQASLHHGHLFHASGPNQTETRRVGISIRYITPAMKQTNGQTVAVAHVSGEDHFRHFRIVEPPIGRLTEEDFERAIHDAKFKKNVLCSGVEPSRVKEHRKV